MVKGKINDDDYNQLFNNNPLIAKNRVDFSGVTGVKLSSFENNYKQLILPEESNISSVPYNCEYIIIVSVYLVYAALSFNG